MEKSTARKLEAFAKFIEKLPRKVINMESWANIKIKNRTDLDPVVCKADVLEPKGNACGTACCLAGWEVLRRGYCLDDSGNVYKKNRSIRSSAANFARESLGLSSGEASKLFFRDRWPGYSRGYYDFETGRWEHSSPSKFKGTPKGAAARIRHLIKTGE